MDNTQLQEGIEALSQKAQAISEKLESAESPESVRDLKAQLQAVQEEVQPLVQQRETVLLNEAVKDMKGQITTLENALTEMRKPSSFEFSGGVPVTSGKSQEYEGSFFADVRRSNKGDLKAQERIAQAHGADSAADVKAMTEGTDAAGGYLVPTQRLQDVLEIRGVDTGEQIINLFPSLQVISDSVEIASITSGMTAGWVAELAAKPVSDLAFGQITASVFTAAGLGVVSNQLLSDSRANGRAVDNFILADLRKRLNQVYATAILDGTGTGQPLGLLRQVGRQPLTLATWSVTALLDIIVDGLFLLENEGFNATHIIMHPRRWQKIAKFRDANTGEAIANGNRFGEGGLPGRSIYGVPVVTTKLLPTNGGAGTNQDDILIVDASEQLRLEREGIAVDESKHVYFTSNQTVFRAERRVGFTGARYPKSIVHISGAGLVP